MNRRRFLSGAGALALGALGAACSPGTDGHSLVLGLTYIPNVQFSPFYVAQELGLFKDAGLDVSLRHHGAQEDLFTAMLSGQEDLVLASSDEAVVAASNGAALQTFATVYHSYPVVVLTADPAIRELGELQGAAIGLPGRYGSNWYGLQAALAGASMTEADIEVVEIGYTQVTALTTGKVDAVVGFRNNEAVQFNTLSVPVSQLEVQDPREPTLYGPGLITVADTIDTDVLRRLKDAVLEAEERIAQDPGLAMEATLAHVPSLTDGAQRTNAEGVLEASITMWQRDGRISLDVDESGFQRMGRFLSDIGIIDSPPADVVKQT